MSNSTGVYGIYTSTQKITADKKKFKAGNELQKSVDTGKKKKVKFKTGASLSSKV